MTRFYFHIRHRDCLFEDRVGVEMRSPAEAWIHAVASARQLIEDDALEGPIDEQSVEIEDDTGRLIASMPFGRSLPLN